MLPVFLVLTPTTGRGALLAYESFNYAPGTDVLTLQNTSTGFTDVWRDFVSPGLARVDVAGGSLSSPGLVTANNKAVFDQRRATLEFDTSLGSALDTAGYLDGFSNIGANGTTFYLSMLMQHSTGTDGFAGMLLMRDSSTNNAADQIGVDISNVNHSGSNDWFLSNYQGGVLAAGSDSLLTGPNSATNLFVLEFIFGAANADTVNAYVNGTLQGTVTGTDFSFDRISFANFLDLQGANQLSVDEIRAGGSILDVTPTPEPSRILLLGVSMATVMLRRRRMIAA